MLARHTVAVDVRVEPAVRLDDPFDFGNAVATANLAGHHLEGLGFCDAALFGVSFDIHLGMSAGFSELLSLRDKRPALGTPPVKWGGAAAPARARFPPSVRVGGRVITWPTHACPPTWGYRALGIARNLHYVKLRACCALLTRCH